MAKKKFYAVRVGKKVGVYTTWAECQQYTKGVSGASFKSFTTMEEAKDFINPKSTHTFSDEKDASIIDIFIDGSFEQSLQRYSFGMVVDSDERVTLNKCFNDERFLVNRNVSGELLGAMYAFGWILENKKENVLYRINYDYEGIEKWATSDWKSNKALTKCYAVISKYVMGLVDIKFNKVPAHSGVELNEVVDQLAKEALAQPVSKIELGYMDFEEIYDEVILTVEDEHK
jgi:ribonuclease HI